MTITVDRQNAPIMVYYTNDSITAHVEKDGDKLVKEVNWAGIGAVSTKRAKEYALNIINMTEFADLICGYVESGEIDDIVANHVWVNEQYKFVPMEYHFNGFLGIDVNSLSVKYFQYGRLFYEFERYEQELDELRKEHKATYHKLREEQKANA